MLQYSVQLPPLSITSSKPRNRSRVASSKQLSAQAAAAHGSAPSNSKRMDVRSPPYAHSPVPLPLTTTSPLSPSISSGSPSPPPTPSLSSAYPFPQTSSPLGTPLMTSKPAPRSPYIPSSTLPVNVPGTRSPYPSKSILLPSSGLPSPTLPNVDSHLRSTSSTPSSFSSSVLDVLSPGDVIGEGLGLQGEVVRCVPITSLPAPDLAPASSSQSYSAVAGSSNDEPARTFEVVKKLGTGSYAVVYLVREVLYRAPEQEDRYEDDGADLDMSMDGHGDVESIRSRTEVRDNEYRREYAIKLLSKANLDTEALEAQVLEAQIHQSLPKHPNIVSLHRVLDTPAFLLLVLEPLRASASPILEAQSPPTSESDCSISSIESSRTPSTPSLLSSLSPSKILSRKRLRLIASMFSQMCDALATCHERGVFHRNIKPENFIVTDGMMEVREPRTFGEGEEQTTEIVMKRERKVVVKLTDFGLSTNEMHSGDMDCGSAPYMSFECRNNVHDTYMPRAADVWSLGIVLINMLYHHNPWTDAAFDVCPSFTLFRQNPTYFFLSRFSGMTPAVADFLANRVFCQLPEEFDDSPRVSARQFGVWIRDLPDLLAPQLPATPSSRPGSAGHVRTPSINLVNIAEIHAHRLSSIPHSRRPSLRSAAGSRNPSLLANQRTSWALSRASSLGPAPEEHERLFQSSAGGVGLGVLPAVIDQEGEDEHENYDQEQELESACGSRSASQAKRRKRGARKGKGAAAAAAAAIPSTPLPSTQDQTLEVLASASQALARELSKTSKTGSVSSPHTTSSAMGSFNVPERAPLTPVIVAAPLPPAPIAAAPAITKKPSKWKLGFGKSSSNSSSAAKEPVAANPTQSSSATTINNVSNLIMGLDAPSKPAASTARQHSPYLQQHAPPSSSSFASTNAQSRYAPSQNSSVVSLDDPAWARGRRNRANRAADPGDGMWGASTVSAFANTSRQPTSNLALPPSSSSVLTRQRGVSPASASQVSVMSASTASSNWRSSMSSASSAATSSSAFTRYSNGSVRSISTTATSVSNTSWRSANSKPAPVGQTIKANGREIRLPANVKCQCPSSSSTPCDNADCISRLSASSFSGGSDHPVVDGHSWELSEVPRGQYIDPENMTFSPPPQRKRAQKPKNASNLDTISERPVPLASSSSKPEASMSNTDLNSAASEDGEGSPGSPRKVQKGQINALAKMLSALRR
ncbi:hypothetical protein BDY19DRAFT_989831 [Irpex rosettiformis]|uniref:Uncharacterized protein n=1 Tax=Irpex rosettiformis TaxID=378272 RepID=A0ACB8UFV9_9APHY|nr:hypothetical protein BDY19DRAFT_989831 [Irpex rosettiformis]